MKIDPLLKPIIDIPRFSEWMLENVSEFEKGDFEIRRLAGGASNVTMSVLQRENHWVMRRPPFGPYPPSAHDMPREFMFYKGMQETAVPVPRARGLCRDQSILGAPFFVMDYVDGLIVNSKSEASGLDIPERRELCQALAETLAAIHSVDVEASGLGGLVRQGGYAERQIKRLTNQWEKFNPSENSSVGELGKRLASCLPEELQSTVVHGDFRFGNVMVSRNDPGETLAVLDWELGAIGDPIADLGYSLIFWGSHNPSLEPSGEIPDLEGFMSEGELIQAYVDAGGANADRIAYYKVLAWFKLAVMSQSFIEREKLAGGNDVKRITLHRDRMAAIALETANQSHIRGLNGR